MNATVRNLTFFTLAIMAFSQAMAQKASFTTNNGMLIGFGFGGSYQQSDIANSRGAGFDFTLGHPIYKKENAFFSVDWKLRFLAGENKAYDHRMNPDTTYNNIRLDIVNCDLEFGLTLNRLRERTRIVITGFAGAGMTYGSTFTDLYDGNGLLYDFSVINPNQERSKVHSDLLKLSDGNFETSLVKRAALFPTLGFFIGYQFSRSFMLGIEHKTNFSLSEQNRWGGINIDNNILSGSKMDRIHYTTLSLRWNLRGRSSRSTGSYSYSGINNATPADKAIEATEPITPPPPARTVYQPVVDITDPAGNTYSTTEGRVDISALIQNVQSRQDIQVVLNGNNVGFEFDPGTGRIRSALVLAEGQNNLVITGTNQAGSARDNVTITLSKPVRIPLPVIRFINPPEPVTVDRNIFELNVQTVNVSAWQDVTVTINGTNTNNFNFSTQGEVRTNIALKEGTNSIEVSGKNESGTTKEMTTITYIKPVKIKAPVVNILIPETDPFVTYQPSHEIRATITDVKGKENISLSVNNLNLPNFTFDNISFILNATISLKEGRNEIKITGWNEGGQAVKSLNIIKETKPVTEVKPVIVPIPCSLPELKMIAPAQIGQTTDNQSYTFIAEVKNINRREQLLLTLNSKIITNFEFDESELSCTASLNTGNNSFLLTAKNDCGTNTLTSSIIYKPAEPVIITEKPCPAPGLNFSVDAVNQPDATHELKGTLSNIKNRSDITMTVNGTPYDGFQFVPNAGKLGARFKFNPGTHIIMVNVSNECGQASGSDTVIIQQPRPCPQPALRMIAPAQNDLITDNSLYSFRTEVKNITGNDQLLLTLNSISITGFNFDGRVLSYSASLIAGSNSFVLTAKNSCGSSSVTSSIIYRPAEPVIIVEKPCPTPGVTFSVDAINQADATHELKGTVSNVKNRSEIIVTVNGTTWEGFQFIPNTGLLSGRFNFNPGTHTIQVNVKNECGQASGSETVEIKEVSVCGIRFNPGNSPWEFCLVTPSGTFNRENLTNSNFSYSGPASSLFIMPVAGGGDAVVEGKSYTLKPGQYYLFEGNLTVTVSSKIPGSMGQWSVCIISDKEPVFGNGSNRPQSPCEDIKDESTQKKNTPSRDTETSRDIKSNQEFKKDTTKTVGPKTGGKK